MKRKFYSQSRVAVKSLWILMLFTAPWWNTYAAAGDTSLPAPQLVDTSHPGNRPAASLPEEPNQKIKIPSGPMSAVTFRQPPIFLKVQDVLPPNLANGSNYIIKETVQNDGIMNTYDLQTSYGMERVETTSALLVRINELRAIVKMEKLKQTGVFKKSLVSGVKAPVKLAGDVLQAPVQTAGKVAVGAGNFLSNVARSIFCRDPHQDNVFKVAVGYDVAKRKFAYEFMINPYTDYEPVVKQLGEISRAAVAGGIVPRAAMQAVGGVAGMTLGLTATAKSMKKLVMEKGPAELESINRKKLLSMGVSEELCKAFLQNYNYDPETATILVGELYAMKRVDGRDLFIAEAVLAENRVTALFYRVMADMMEKYHSSYVPAQRLGLAGSIPYLINIVNAAVFQLPVDYVFWTNHVAAKLSDIDKEIGQLPGIRTKEMWLSGRIDQDAWRAFSAKGWKVVQNANPLTVQEAAGE